MDVFILLGADLAGEIDPKLGLSASLSMYDQLL